MSSDSSLDGLRRELMARYDPADALETHWVERLLSVVQRQQLLEQLELRVLQQGMVHGSGAAGEGGGLPSLSMLCRCRHRLERDYRHAVQTLEELRVTRPPGSPAGDSAPVNDNHDTALGWQDYTNEPEDLETGCSPPLNRAERRRLRKAKGPTG